MKLKRKLIIAIIFLVAIWIGSNKVDGYYTHEFNITIKNADGTTTVQTAQIEHSNARKVENASGIFYTVDGLKPKEGYDVARGFSISNIKITENTDTELEKTVKLKLPVIEGYYKWGTMIEVNGEEITANPIGIENAYFRDVPLTKDEATGLYMIQGNIYYTLEDWKNTTVEEVRLESKNITIETVDKGMYKVVYYTINAKPGETPFDENGKCVFDVSTKSIDAGRYYVDNVKLREYDSDSISTGRYIYSKQELNADIPVEEKIDVFKEGHTYEVTITVKSVDGYYFTSSPMLNINNNERFSTRSCSVTAIGGMSGYTTADWILTTRFALKPEEVEAPEEPEEPTTPVIPDENEKPSTPVTPDETENPSTPVTPDESGKPTTPIIPDETEPETPNSPSETEPVNPNTDSTVLSTDSSSTVKTIIDAENELPSGSRLVVNETSISTELKNSETKLKKVLDISVLDENSNIVKIEDNKMSITIELDEELLVYNTYEVVYIKDGKIVEKLGKASVSDGKLTFVTSHLSEYGILAYNEEKTAPESTGPKTGDAIIAYVVVLTLAVIGSGAIISKKIISNKKNRQ